MKTFLKKRFIKKEKYYMKIKDVSRAGIIEGGKMKHIEIGFGAAPQRLEIPDRNLAGVLLPNQVASGLAQQAVSGRRPPLFRAGGWAGANMPASNSEFKKKFYRKVKKGRKKQVLP
jgi:hypothetical protein